MVTTRHAALAIMLMTIATQPALAETCNLTMNGRLALDDAPCAVTSRGSTITIHPDRNTTIEIGRSILLANVGDDLYPPAHRRNRHGLRSFGRVVKSNDLDDKTCYFNQHVTLCVTR
ncbi:MAG TPA: hypothetical protein VH414_03895 [Lichenihabitans sp.]|jgi:hypothetical protein|nr:hypothetical protein [Lichenihabitans sp.]